MRISTNQIYQRALNSLMNQQLRLSKLSDQINTGLRVLTPSDDPIASAQIELINQRISFTEMLQKNRQSVESGLSYQEGILGNTVATLQSLREIQIQAGNSAYTEEDRKALGIEAKSLLIQLQDYANSKDSNGNYMFSGAQSATQAISLNASGNYVYNGDNTQRFQAITGSLQIAINDTGDDLFMRIPNGNGRFTITQTATPNAGTASVTTGSVDNAAAYIPDNYTMSFATNSQGQLVVMVSGALSGNVVPPTGLADDAPVYQEGAAITFNGMGMTLSGTPQAGDAFSINPSQNESVFSTVQRMIVNLNKPFSSAVDKAATQTENNQLLAQVDSALTNILNAQSDVGSRLNQLDFADKTNTNFIDTSKEVLKKLREIDPNQAYTDYALQLNNLEVARQSFIRVQGLSIFNYM